MDSSQNLISAATQRNWGKLGTEGSGKLKSRANKTRSEKTVVPDNYICQDGLDAVVAQMSSAAASDTELFYGFCLQKLSRLGDRENVRRFVSEYGGKGCVDVVVPDSLLSDTGCDWLGYLYQLRVPEGQRNLRGQYYTNSKIVDDMLARVTLGKDKSFCDPCCGTGAFLMNVKADSLSQLYGADIDEVAVMIAKANLIALYPDDATYPQIYCEDYLEDSLFSAGKLSGKRFDYIYTNPPWGVCKTYPYSSDVILSGERSSLFFVKAFGQLKAGGSLNFLLPSSLLKVKAHSDFRSFVLRKTRMEEITLFKERFNGVFTDFFSLSAIKHEHEEQQQSYRVRSEGKTFTVNKSVAKGDTEIRLNGSEEQQILDIIEARGYDTLCNSKWALGIVTGDNKNKLKKEKEPGTEAIYTGKEIGHYLLGEPTNFIHYDRSQLQQCAKDEYYRCREKLVYKFISKNLCFAYDDSSSLFLNSANILIPHVSGMSIKTVLAFLNSELFSYYYAKRFTDIKVLKGNLMTLPFPKLTEQQNEEMAEMVDRVLKGDTLYIENINDYVYPLYGLSSFMINRIKQELYGNTNFSA